MSADRKTTLLATVGIEIILTLLVLANRRPLGDIILVILMALVAIAAAVVLFGGSNEKRREQAWARARSAAKWERRTHTSHGRTSVFLVRVARRGGESQQVGEAEPVGASISTDDPAWQAIVLDREAQADERLFFLNRTP